MAGKLERKHLDKPDETRVLKDGKGKLDVVTVGVHTLPGAYSSPAGVGRNTLSRSPERHLAKLRTPAMSWKGTWR